MTPMSYAPPGRCAQSCWGGGRARCRRPRVQQTILFASRWRACKVRTGPPKDDEADLELPIWAGLLPLETSGGLPESSPDLLQGIDVPAYIGLPRRPDPGRLDSVPPSW
jgi:hypothetical protein